MKHPSKQIKFQKTLKVSDQYTYVATLGNFVYVRARRNDGTPLYVKQKYTPIYYIPCNEADATHWGYDGTPLIPHMCDSIYEGKEFVQESKLPVYGDIQPEYMLLSDCYGSKDVHFDMDVLYIWDIDIEVDRDPIKGYAPIEDPFNAIVGITVIWRHMGQTGKVIYGLPSSKAAQYKPIGNELFVRCETEEELLLRFIDDFRSAGDYPDILTGWNIQFFDIPYLVNRCKRLFTEEIWIRLSPFDRMAERRVILYGREQIVIDLQGVAILDYYELYQKLRGVQRESYRLDYIGHVELKTRKVSYAEYRSLDRLYRENYQLFVEYNLRDVQIVEDLDAKLKLIELVCALAYGAKSNFADCFKQVRLWDIMIYHKLRTEDKQIPPRKQEDKDYQYAGAYVKDPLVGYHKWVCSFDVASMYPHIIREWNLSPEMILGMGQDFGINIPADTDKKVEMALHRQFDLSLLKSHDVCMAVNGAVCRRDAEGFLPNMLKTLYDERIRFKKLMKDAKKELEKETDPAKRKELEKKVAAYNNQQAVRKVNLNSAYGAIGSNYFRFFNVALAEGVTVTGQAVIRWVAKDINDYLNKQFKTGNKDYIIASDTDSVYIAMDKVAEVVAAVKNKNGTERSTTQIVDALNQFCEKKIQPIINQSFVNIAEYFNVAIPCLSMVRDVIADKAVWTAKKRYIMNVHDSEGVRYKKPELKMMGIEAIKSSTPGICRKMITDVLNLFMNGTQEQVWEYIPKAREEFKRASFEDVAWPRSVNGLLKWAGRDKGVPIHVRGALAFNDMLKRMDMRQYEPIHEGEKIKYAYLREPNKFRTNVMSAPGGCPPEWNIEEFIDYDEQFAKSFVEPLEAILKCAGWSTEHEASLW